MDVSNSLCQVKRKPLQFWRKITQIFHFTGDSNTKICGSSNEKCYTGIKLKFFDVHEDNPGKSFRDKCNCLPACVSIEYNPELIETKANYEIIDGLVCKIVFHFSSLEIE